MRAALIATTLALAACGQQAPPGADTAPAADTAPPQVQAAATAAVNNCPATASTQWSAGGDTFTIDAAAAGENCASATVTIAIHDAHGASIQAASYEASTMTPLSGAESVDDMSRMLREWITPAGASMDSTGDLAAWAAGAPTPSDAGVAYTPASGVTRAAYEALRRADAPM